MNKKPEPSFSCRKTTEAPERRTPSLQAQHVAESEDMVIWRGSEILLVAVIDVERVHTAAERDAESCRITHYADLAGTVIRNVEEILDIEIRVDGHVFDIELYAEPRAEIRYDPPVRTFGTVGIVNLLYEFPPGKAERSPVHSGSPSRIPAVRLLVIIGTVYIRIPVAYFRSKIVVEFVFKFRIYPPQGDIADIAVGTYLAIERAGETADKLFLQHHITPDTEIGVPVLGRRHRGKGQKRQKQQWTEPGCKPHFQMHLKCKVTKIQKLLKNFSRKIRDSIPEANIKCLEAA